MVARRRNYPYEEIHYRTVMTANYSAPQLCEETEILGRIRTQQALTEGPYQLSPLQDCRESRAKRVQL